MCGSSTGIVGRIRIRRWGSHRRDTAGTRHPLSASFHPAIGTPRRRVYPAVMGRTKRTNLPGAPFHLIARLQDGKTQFSGSEPQVLAALARTVRETRTRLLAYAIMSNHLHLLLVQNRHPLANFMQPLLCRLALLVRRRHGGTGHVFQGRYRAHACLDARRLRAAIVYIHLNPVRAGVCRDPLDYAWTSHGAYCCPGQPSWICSDVGVQLFAEDMPGDAACRDAYRRYVTWRCSVDELEQQAERVAGDWIDRPATPQGDAAWWSDFNPSDPELRRSRLDLEAIARHELVRFPGLTLDDLRGGGRIPSVTNARRLVIARALGAGYANAQIARYLRVSASAVSRIACERRRQATDHA
jgi:REP element-mobilizing transposase RayT